MMATCVKLHGFRGLYILRSRGWSHRSVLTPSVGIFGCNSVKSGGPTSISQHNPQQFHVHNQTESLVWSGHHETPYVSISDDCTSVKSGGPTFPSNSRAESGRKVWCHRGMKLGAATVAGSTRQIYHKHQPKSFKFLTKSRHQQEVKGAEPQARLNYSESLSSQPTTFCKIDHPNLRSQSGADGE